MINIECNSQLLKTVAHLNVILVDNGAGCRIFFQGLVWDSRAVLIASANEQHVLPQRTQITNVDIGWDISAGQMPDVFGAISVRQRGSNSISLELFHKVSL